MDSKSAQQSIQRSGLPWPVLVIVGALALLGVVQVVNWFIGIFVWLITIAVVLVILVALLSWLISSAKKT